MVKGLSAIGISTDPERDVVKTGDKVKERLSQLEELMPVGIELVTLYPENEIAREANNGFLLNLVESVVIVIFIILLVMGTPCRVTDRFLVDFLDRWNDADHAVYGSRVEPDVAGSFYYSNGYAGG